MSSPVRLTIITPVFNGSAYIRQCISNVANQWVEGVEHLIADGGSTDETAEIIASEAEKHAQITWFSEKDEGQSDAMNKALKRAKGEWVSFLNVDDYYQPGTLGRLLELISKQKTMAVLVGNLAVINPDGSLQHMNKPAHMSLPRLLADMCEWPYNPSAYFYPKKIHDSIGYFPVHEHYAMDYDFILKVALAKIPFQYFNEHWGNFRLLPEAKTGTDQAANTSYHRAEALRAAAIARLGILEKCQVYLYIGFWKVRNKLLSIAR